MDIVLKCNLQGMEGTGTRAGNLVKWRGVGQTALFCITGQQGKLGVDLGVHGLLDRISSDVAPLPPIRRISQLLLDRWGCPEKGQEGS